MLWNLSIIDGINYRYRLLERRKQRCGVACDTQTFNSKQHSPTIARCAAAYIYINRIARVRYQNHGSTTRWNDDEFQLLLFANDPTNRELATVGKGLRPLCNTLLNRHEKWI